MKTLAARIFVLAACSAAAVLQAGAQEILARAPRFAAVDVFIESLEPMAAWQFELTERSGLMTIVGVENGESAAFENTPHYDLEAVERGRAERIVVADYTLRNDASLPVGSTRIATIHVRLDGAGEPDYQLRLIAAGNANGRAIDAAISLREPIGREQ